MGQQIINNGETGAVVRGKINANFSELYTGPLNRIPKYNAGGGYTPSLLIDDGTNVGLGTALPTAKLHVEGVGVDTGKFVSTANHSVVTISGFTGFNSYVLFQTNGVDKWDIAAESVTGGFRLYDRVAGQPRIFVDATGKVGIGTITPGQKLEVVGRIYSNGDQFQSSAPNGTWVFGGFSAISGVVATDGDFAIYGVTTPASRFVIKELTGFVGIGTINPSTLFEVNSATTGEIVKIWSEPATLSAITLGIGVLTAGRPFIGVNATSNPLEIGTRSAIGDVRFVTNSLLRVIVLGANGFVGIGTPAPTSILHILHATDPLVKVYNSTNNYSEVQVGNIVGELQLGFEGPSNNTRMGGSLAFSPYLGTQANKGFTFHTNNLLRMHLSASGGLCVGSTDALAFLEVRAPNNFPPGLGNPGGHFMFGVGAYGFTSGVAGSGNIWMQAQRFDGAATSYQLCLQPSGGAVGIGTMVPNYKLEVNSGNIGIVNSTNSALIDFVSSIGNWQIGSDPFGNGTNNNHFYIYENSTATYRFTVNRGTGNVGVGTAAPGAKMQVAGTILATAFTPSSDRRLKKNIQLLPSGLEKALKIASIVSTYDLISGELKDQVGFIAQELQEIAPEYVYTSTSKDGMMAVNYGQMVALLYKAVAELEGKINSK